MQKKNKSNIEGNLYYNDKVIKTVWYWHIDQWNSTEIDLFVNCLKLLNVQFMLHFLMFNSFIWHLALIIMWIIICVVHLSIFAE